MKTDKKHLEELKAIYKNNFKWFKLAEEILMLSYNVFPLKNIVEAKISLKVINAILSLYTQSFRLFKSIVILCRHGLDSEALIQVRSLIDVTSYLLYIGEEESDDRLDWYFHSKALSRKIAAEEYLRYLPDEKIDLEWHKNKEVEAIAYLAQKYNKTKEEIKKEKQKYTLRADIAAQSLKYKEYEKHYRIVHRSASQIMHGDDLLEFISVSDNDSKYLLKIGPSEKWIQLCLYRSTVSMCFNLEIVNNLLNLGNDEQIDNMLKKLKDFIKNINNGCCEEGKQ